MGFPWGRRARRFEHLAVPHMAAVYRLAHQLVEAQAAEDLVQETYLRAWKYFDGFDPDTNCRAWLMRILRNVWVDRWHKHRLELPLRESEADYIEPYYDWEDEFLSGHFSPEVSRALDHLPEEYRWAVLLVDVEEFTYREIAEILKCPVGTVMSRINRGRRMLARLLRGPAGEDARDTRQPARGRGEES